MTIQELAALIDGTVQTKTVDTSREVTCGYTCDLLSWVMAKGKEGMAWATVQAHMNVVAVAVLADMSCVIAAEGVQFGADVLEKAEEEGIALITTGLSAYHVAGACTKRASPEKKRLAGPPQLFAAARVMLRAEGRKRAKGPAWRILSIAIWHRDGNP